ncbi:hypothetical protein [Marinobacter sp. P4B1]|uniref:hypothetical protein n=1 Tax=Marinobacter sp. P4B1 TaxID=1119533 RepID=UPI00071D26B2|nr:hypothetical protein [Marinobacter sp. P4B1]KRW83755.1 hypothetical protein AQ621_17040 [Marinobacter sp. P4B1]
MVVMKSNETFRSGFTNMMAFWHDEFSMAGSDQAYKELCRDQLAILVERQKAFERLVKAFRAKGANLEVKATGSDRWCAFWGTDQSSGTFRCQIFDQEVFVGTKHEASISELLYWCVMQGLTEPTADSVNLAVEPEWRKGIQVVENSLAA